MVPPPRLYLPLIYGVFASNSNVKVQVISSKRGKRYRAAKAEQRAWDEALRPKPCKLIGSPELCRLIAVKLKRAWAPQQIAGWLKRQYPDNQEMNVSHETIFKTLFIQTRGALKKELQQCLRKKSRT